MENLQIIGRLGADPEETLTTQGATCARLRIAVNHKFAREGQAVSKPSGTPPTRTGVRPRTA